MSDIGIGKLITGEAFRDAIHVAVAPVANDGPGDLFPGQRVRLKPGTTDKAQLCSTTESIGIIDPFLQSAVRPGERCYLFLYPGSITSLRHDWTHFAFRQTPAPAASPVLSTSDVQNLKAESEKWLRRYARNVNRQLGDDEAYTTLLDDLRLGQIIYHGKDMHTRAELIDEEDLKRHAEIVMGTPINFDNFEYFSCTC